MTKENIDQWMFKNVEGELTPEQTEQLSSFIITNPDFEEEFHKWNNANFKNIEIEEYKHLDSILQKKSFYWKNKYTFFLGLLIGAFAWLPFAFKNSDMGAAQRRVKNISVKSIEKQKVKEILIEEPVQSEHKSVYPSEVKREVRNNEIRNEKSFMALTEVSTEEIQKIEKVEISTIDKSYSKRKLITKKAILPRPEKTKEEIKAERRELRRRNNKAKIKYIKGDGPGVIPMNNIGF